MSTSLWHSAFTIQAGLISSTIYVGRHFEVRDQDQPTKYVFNGPTRVAAITGTLSTGARLQRWRIYPGWNLVSLVVTANDLPAQLQRNQSGGVDSVYKWNAATEDYSPITSGETIAAGTVLWIKANNHAIVGINGFYVNPTTAHIQGGGAYVAVGGLEVLVPTLSAGLTGWTYDPATQQWQNSTIGEFGFLSESKWTLASGQAAYIQTTEAADLEPPDPTLRIRYYHQDHLGSTSVMTDTAGVMIEEIDSYPFGSPRNQFMPRQVHEPYGFTQKERDDESGLDYFETRFLAAAVARFIRPDLKYLCDDQLSESEFSGYVLEPQRMNLYSYVRNNPLRYTDPLGEDAKRRAPPEPSPADTGVSLTLKLGGEEMNVAVLSVQVPTAKPLNMSGTGKDPQKPELHDIVITKNTDKSSTRLWRQAVDPHATIEGELTFRRVVAGHSEVYLRIKLENVVISGFSESGMPARESITLSAKIRPEFPAEAPAVREEAADPFWNSWRPIFQLSPPGQSSGAPTSSRDKPAAQQPGTK